jgi:hypothetical protein
VKRIVCISLAALLCAGRMSAQAEEASPTQEVNQQQEEKLPVVHEITFMEPGTKVIYEPQEKTAEKTEAVEKVETKETLTPQAPEPAGEEPAVKEEEKPAPEAPAPVNVTLADVAKPSSEPVQPVAVQSETAREVIAAPAPVAVQPINQEKQEAKKAPAKHHKYVKHHAKHKKTMKCAQCVRSVQHEEAPAPTPVVAE